MSLPENIDVRFLAIGFTTVLSVEDSAIDDLEAMEADLAQYTHETMLDRAQEYAAQGGRLLDVQEMLFSDVVKRGGKALVVNLPGQRTILACQDKSGFYTMQQEHSPEMEDMVIAFTPMTLTMQ